MILVYTLHLQRPGIVFVFYDDRQLKLHNELTLELFVKISGSVVSLLEIKF